MRFIRGVLVFLLIVIVLVAAVGGGGYLYLTRRAFPQIDGTIQAAGLAAPATVIRDKNGIPHIYAANIHDLFFAQGYVQAQDRLWQMEATRRGVAGRTSELQPSLDSLQQDKFVLTLGWRRAAQADYNALDDKNKTILQAYADGVNAFIAKQSGNLPIEFTIVGAFGSQGLNYKPEPWTPIDTLQWAKAMAWSLGGNWQSELFRAKLLAKFGDDQGRLLLADLVPPYATQKMPVIVPPGVSWQNIPAGVADLRVLDAISGPRGQDIGSNDWTIAGSRTTTGKPILANDPHLGIQMPSIWYFNSLHCQPVTADCPFDVTGATFPGVAGVIIGHNARIAWGVTNTGPDVEDLFLEKITGNQYEYQGKQLDLTLVPETLKIKGKVPSGYQASPNETDNYDAASDTTTIILNVRYTRHGPLISDVNTEAADAAKLAGDQLAVAFSWTAINAPEKTLASFTGIDTANNWDEFRAALSSYGTPSQNFVYADVDGNIGYQMPGRIPIRAGSNGELPVPGWTGEYEWTGYIPFDELPRSYNPAQGFIATANNAVVGPDYKYFITSEWDRGYRARRIVDLITAKDKLSLDDIAAIQGDNVNLSAKEIIPYLSNLTAAGDAQKVLDAIKGWDFHEQRDSGGAAAYEVFWYYLLRNTFDARLGDLAATYVTGGDLNRQALALLLAKPDSTWWSGTSRDEVLKKSLADAAQRLISELGPEPAKWTWSQIHTGIFKSQALGRRPVGFIFNRGPVSVDGGSAIINATGGSFSVAYDTPTAKLTDLFAERSVPSLRQIVDMSNLNTSRYIHTTGQSGLPTDPHYDDMIDPWRNIQYVPMWWDIQDIKANAEGTLTLTP